MISTQIEVDRDKRPARGPWSGNDLSAVQAMHPTYGRIPECSGMASMATRALLAAGIHGGRLDCRTTESIFVLGNRAPHHVRVAASAHTAEIRHAQGADRRMSSHDSLCDWRERKQGGEKRSVELRSDWRLRL